MTLYVSTSYISPSSRTDQPGSFHLFRIDVEDIGFIRYDDPTSNQFVTRWPNKAEFVRRGITATSVGPPEPHQEPLSDR